mgnify:CR=1 FL=1
MPSVVIGGRKGGEVCEGDGVFILSEVAFACVRSATVRCEV